MDNAAALCRDIAARSVRGVAPCTACDDVVHACAARSKRNVTDAGPAATPGRRRGAYSGVGMELDLLAGAEAPAPSVEARGLRPEIV